MRLYLMRHGQTAMNKQNLALGQKDVPLSEFGEKQVQLLGERFKGVKIDRIISSDLSRCRVTAQAIADATGAPIEVDARIRERSFGDWESQDYVSVNERLLEMTKHGQAFYEVKPPNGESHADIWNRIAPVMDPLFDVDEDIAIVSHGGTSRVLIAYLLRGTLSTTFCFKVDNAAVTQLDRRPDGNLLLSVYNDTSHLSGLETD